VARLPRPKPKRLPEKLKAIRVSLDLSQSELLEKLGLAQELELPKRYWRSTISGYETGNKEPPLPIILKYARLVGISTDILLDDSLDYP
jgi:transcriptional regulator with XRE-family HTH domain